MNSNKQQKTTSRHAVTCISLKPTKNRTCYIPWYRFVSRGNHLLINTIHMKINISRISSPRPPPKKKNNQGALKYIHCSLACNYWDEITSTGPWLPPPSKKKTRRKYPEAFGIAPKKWKMCASPWPLDIQIPAEVCLFRYVLGMEFS